VRAFRRVTLPLLLPNIATGAVFAFVASWDEVVVALFLATPTMRTLPVTMWEEATHSMDPTVAAASSMLTAITSVALVVILLLRRSRGRAATRKEVL
jgi:putative spermidine/putrescine transport system permease protein